MSNFQPLYAPYTPSPNAITVTVVELSRGEWRDDEYEWETAVTTEAVTEGDLCAITRIGAEEDIAQPVRRVIGQVEARVVVRGNLTNCGRYHTVELPDGERHTLILPGT